MNHFKDYVDKVAAETARSLNQVRQELAKKSGLTAQSMRNFYNGMAVGTMRSAMAIQIATRGALKMNKLIEVETGHPKEKIRAALRELT